MARIPSWDDDMQATANLLELITAAGALGVKCTVQETIGRKLDQLITAFVQPEHPEEAKRAMDEPKGQFFDVSGSGQALRGAPSSELAAHLETLGRVNAAGTMLAEHCLQIVEEAGGDLPNEEETDPAAGNAYATALRPTAAGRLTELIGVLQAAREVSSGRFPELFATLERLTKSVCKEIDAELEEPEEEKARPVDPEPNPAGREAARVKAQVEGMIGAAAGIRAHAVNAKTLLALQPGAIFPNLAAKDAAQGHQTAKSSPPDFAHLNASLASLGYQLAVVPLPFQPVDAG